jgi:hypothetical protein
MYCSISEFRLGEKPPRPYNPVSSIGQRRTDSMSSSKEEQALEEKGIQEGNIVRTAYR